MLANSGIQVFSREPRAASDSALPFRFEVTWNSLFPSSTTPDRSIPPDPVVLPFVEPPEALPVPVPSEPEVPLAVPQFSTTEQPSRAGLLPTLLGAVLCVALGASVVLWMCQAPAATNAAGSPAMEMGEGGWVSEWASDAAGSARGRQLSLYRPSMPKSDYRLEFLGRIHRKSLGWVFRVVDSKNYYAVKLEAPRPEATTLTMTRFAVVHGIQRGQVERILPLPSGAGSPIKVRMDASGPHFSVWVQNQVVEDWVDDRLRSGGVGFLNEKEEQGEIQSVQISFQQGGGR